MKANGYEIAAKANLRGADLRRADLRRADLRRADLQGADLQEANLRGANLWGANLRGANLRGADLQGANPRGADLRGANLRETNLDFSSGIPYHCGGTKIIGGERLFAQMIFHLTRQDWRHLTLEQQEWLASIPKEIEDLFKNYRPDVQK